MGRLLKLLLALVVIGFAALVGYAYFGDLSPEVGEVREPVNLDAR